MAVEPLESFVGDECDGLEGGYGHVQCERERGNIHNAGLSAEVS